MAFTEIELIKAYVNDVDFQNGIESKDLLRERFERAYKAWSAFTKLIRQALVRKGHSPINTIYFGCFGI